MRENCKKTQKTFGYSRANNLKESKKINQEKTRETYELFLKLDFYHLAKEFYRYIFRYPELEADPTWTELKQFAEDLIVAIKFRRDPETKMSKEDFRDFIRFYTKLEMKFYDEEKEFIFTETEKNLFLTLRPKTPIS